MKHWTPCFYSEPPSVPPPRTVTHSGNTFGRLTCPHTNICTCTPCRQVSMCEDTHIDAHTHTHAHLCCLQVRGKCHFLGRMEGREGCVVEIDAEQITLPAVADRPESGLLFWNTHTLTEIVRSRLQSALVCWHLCLPLR